MALTGRILRGLCAALVFSLPPRDYRLCVIGSTILLFLLLEWRIGLRSWRRSSASGLGALSRRCVLITGAGKGIGRSLAVQLARRAALHPDAGSGRCLVLALLDIDAAALRAAAEEVRRAGGESSLVVFAYECDVSDETAVESAFARAAEDAAPLPLGVAVASHGVVAGKPLLPGVEGCGALTSADVRRSVGVNLLGAIWVSRALLSRALDHPEGGALVLLSSVMGFMGGARLTDYCATKWALLGFAESLRLELRCHPGSGVGVMAVCPFHVSTGLFAGIFEQDASHWWRPLFAWLRGLIFPMLLAEDVSEAVAASLAHPSGGRLRSLPRVLMLPPLAVVVPPLLRVFPAVLQELILDLAGGCHGMDGFRGRHSGKS